MNIRAIRFSISSALESVVVFTIRCYQKTRFFRAPSCRFYPSCSEYMAGSITRFGVFKGLALGSLRLLKCHPWNDGGVDLVPDELVSTRSCTGHSLNLHHRMQR